MSSEKRLIALNIFESEVPPLKSSLPSNALFERCRWRWKKGPKQRWSGYFSLCPFPSWKGVFSQNGPQRSRARRCCAAQRTLHGEDRSEILDKRERGGPKWTAKMAQSLTASDMPGARHERIATSASPSRSRHKSCGCQETCL